jgi:thymidine kinase
MKFDEETLARYLQYQNLYPVKVIKSAFDFGSIEELWSEFRTNEPTHQTMPFRFLYIIVRTSNQCTTFQELGQQWTILNENEETGDTDGYCVCGHQIHEIHFVKNIHNGNILQIGSECIHKFEDEQLSFSIEVIQRRKQYENNGSGKFRQCRACGKFRIGIKKPDYVTRCKSCYTKDNDLRIVDDFRQCVTCKQNRIPPTDPPYKTQCRDCWIQAQNEEKDDNRPCKYCLKRKILPTEPKWKTVCISCYRRIKSGTFDPDQ